VHNSNGYVTLTGLVRDMDTSAIVAAGDFAFLSAATAGEIVATPPEAPNFKARVGWAIDTPHSSTGVLYVNPIVAPNLASLSDVGPVAPSAGQVPAWDAGDSRFEFASPITAHGDLSGLGDDDHSQYALLAGRASSQTLIGGTGASEILRLASTAHATKGSIDVSV
ncbi:unnamed protein product, partial [marine sediment metagenome]